MRDSIRPAGAVTPITAFFAPLRGFGTIVARPALWPWASTPVAIFAVLAVVGWLAAGHLYARIDHWLANVIGHGAWGNFGAAVAGGLTAILVVAIVLIASLWIVPPLCAPFMDALASRVDRYQGRDEALGAQISRSLRVALAGLFFVAIPQLVLAIVGFVVPPIAPVCILVASVLGALGLAYDALDWPLSRRGLGARQRFAWMRSHPGATLGLGASAWLISLVPGLIVLALPSIVAGAVRVVNEIEAREGVTSGS